MIAAIGSVFSMGYITLHAIELERTQPFFNDTDLVIGWIMMISILALTLIHWGWLLTSVIALAILYFFVGHTFTNPLFMTPKYDHGFIMNYIGLGTNQGFYYLAQIASDQIYFLIIYAAVLLGVGMLNMVLEIGKVTGRHLPGGAAGPAVLGVRNCVLNHGAGGFKRCAHRTPYDSNDEEVWLFSFHGGIDRSHGIDSRSNYASCDGFGGVYYCVVC